MSKPAPDLSIVIVSWNVAELLRRCLASVERSLEAGAGPRCQVVVVDNASTDGSPAVVEEGFPWVELVRNRENAGFSRASNQGLAQSRGRFVLLLNPDTEVLGDALAHLAAYLEAHPRVGLVGPRLLNPDGSTQSSRRTFPTLTTALVESTPLQRYLPVGGLLRRYYRLNVSDDEEQEVDWLSGACLMVRREAAEQVGGLDEGFFMYYEEVDWCRRLRQRGWRVVYLPGARVVHHHAQSSEQDLPARHIRFNASKCRYFRKHHGRLAAGLLRYYLLGTFLFQALEEGAKWLLGHKRPLRRQRVGMWLRVWRSGLHP